jgi:hypothetical protein
MGRWIWGITSDPQISPINADFYARSLAFALAWLEDPLKLSQGLWLDQAISSAKLGKKAAGGASRWATVKGESGKFCTTDIPTHF